MTVRRSHALVGLIGMLLMPQQHMLNAMHPDVYCILMFPSATGCKTPEGHAGIGRNTGRRLQLEQRGQTPGRWTHREELQA